MDERKDGLLDRIFMSFELLDSQRKRKIIENLKGKKVPDKYILFFC